MVGGVERRAVADPRQRAQLSQQARRVGLVCSSRVRHVLSRRVCGAVLNAARDARLVPRLSYLRFKIQKDHRQYLIHERAAKYPKVPKIYRHPYLLSLPLML